MNSLKKYTLHLIGESCARSLSLSALVDHTSAKARMSNVLVVLGNVAFAVYFYKV